MERLKPFRFRSPGIWLPGTRVEVQSVTQRHAKACALCAELPVGLRVAVTQGSGRGATGFILCRSCAPDWIELLLAEGQRVLAQLRGSIPEDEPIRLGWHDSHADAIRLRRALLPRKAADD